MRSIFVGVLECNVSILLESDLLPKQTSECTQIATGRTEYDILDGTGGFQPNYSFRKLLAERPLLGH